MRTPKRIEEAARTRIGAAIADIQNSVEQIDKGDPLQAEPVRQRKIERIAAVSKVNPEMAAQIADGQDPISLGLSGESLGRAEAIQGKTVDYVGIAWLDAGRLASNSVARIVFRDGSPNGTGFLVSNRLLLTNNHVIPDRDAASSMVVEFRYELALGQSAPTPVRFALEPVAFFETDAENDLDFTLVAVGSALTPGATLMSFGSCPLSGSSAKHSVGEPVNLVQHPDGDYKQVVLRENRIVHRGGTVLHYIADTEPGSSGSPVFNDQWQVVALHHWGGPFREISSNGRPLSREVNEGIRISAIVQKLGQRASALTASQQALLREALNAPPPGDFGTRIVALAPSFSPSPQAILAPAIDAGVMRLGEASGAPANRIDREYSNRRGYNARFLRGFPIPMPQLNATQLQQAARVRGIGDSGNPFELKYEHFSVVLNAARRMAFFSICNIDGAKRIRVDRDSGRAVSGPEATEVWAVDPRVPTEAQLSDAFYARLRRDLRTNDFFARGHLTRREDPNWGVAERAERANNDTYHHPNACPQVNNAFNASQKVWQGIENFVLNSTDDSNLRVTVITGPVFRSDDPEYEDQDFGAVRLPRRFWKIVARVEDGERKVFAVLADQSEVMDALIAAGAEAAVPFRWPTKLSREFRSTVAEISQLTGLDFGDLGNHDVFAGGSESLSERIISGPEALVSPRSADGGFGSFSGMGKFLEAWEESQRPAPESLEGDAGEPRGRSRRDTKPKVPAVRRRMTVEIEACAGS